ncbi:prepilin-type N-terminal cleavage/methylation domain-containing protein [Pseudomonadales bacterium]|nr:prepilin-type N-terminal cleavage/methylation domain-containing protein [Pseudomonadales bacterium]
MRNQPPFQTSYQLGVTLVEMVVVIVILGIALTTITQMLAQNTVSGAYTYDETKAIELAQSYSSEIKAKRFDENSPVGGVPPCDAPSAAACTAVGSLGSEPGESARTAFDDVDDYDDLDEGSGSLKALLDAEGNIRTGYENFRVQVQVTYSGDVAPRSGSVSDSKKVVLTITQPNGEALDFTFHRANY